MLGVAVAVQDHDADLLRPDALGLGDQAHVLLGRRGDVDRVRRLGAGRDLLHVDGRAGEEHRAAFGERDHRERVRLAERRSGGSRRSGRRRRRTPGPRRSRPPRRCRASGPRPSRPRRSRRRRPSRRCRSSGASRRRRPDRPPPCRRGRPIGRRRARRPRSRGRAPARCCGPDARSIVRCLPVRGGRRVASHLGGRSWARCRTSYVRVRPLARGRDAGLVPRTTRACAGASSRPACSAGRAPASPSSRRTGDRGAASGRPRGTGSRRGGAASRRAPASAPRAVATQPGANRTRRGSPQIRSSRSTASRVVRLAPESRYRSPGVPRVSARTWPFAQSSMSTSEIVVSTRTGSRPFTTSSRSRAEPVARPGPCTDEGFTDTTSTPRVLRELEHPPFGRGAWSARRRTGTSLGAASPRVRPCPCGSPIVARGRGVDDASDARRRRRRGPRSPSPRRWCGASSLGSRRHIAFTPATWKTVEQPRIAASQRPEIQPVPHRLGARGPERGDRVLGALRASASTCRTRGRRRRGPADEPTRRTTTGPAGDQDRFGHAAGSRPVVIAPRNRTTYSSAGEHGDHGGRDHRPLIQVQRSRSARRDAGSRGRSRGTARWPSPCPRPRARTRSPVDGDRALQADDQDLAADDDHGDPGETRPTHQQADQRARHEQLVGRRVEEVAEHARLRPAPGEQPVEEVGERGDREQRRGDGDAPAAVSGPAMISARITGTSATRAHVTTLRNAAARRSAAVVTASSAS